MSFSGHRHTPETRAKMTATRTGLARPKHTEETRAKIAESVRRHAASKPKPSPKPPSQRTKPPRLPALTEADERLLIDEAVAAGRVTVLQPRLSVCAALSKKGKRCTHEQLPGEAFCERHTGKRSGAIRQSSVFRPANRRIL